MSNKMNGWISLAMAGVTAFVQIWGATHGAPIDTSHVAVAAALAANGAHHVSK